MGRDKAGGMSKALKDSLRRELEMISKADQQYRWMIMLGEVDSAKLEVLRNLNVKDQHQRMMDVMKNKVGLSQHLKDSLNDLQAPIDSINFYKIAGIIQTHGIPLKKWEVYKVTTVFWHSPIGLMTSSFFEMIKKEVINGKLPPLEYAFLYDRTQLAKKLPMRYYALDKHEASVRGNKPDLPIDIEAINVARREIGMDDYKAVDE